jgi:adenosylmethionine-8-amino-7-oxononanoate aminotransferase
MICFAKGVTNGAAPLGGVLVQGRIHDAFMQGPSWFRRCWLLSLGPTGRQIAVAFEGRVAA